MKNTYFTNLAPFILMTSLTLIALYVGIVPSHWVIPLFPIAIGILLSGHLFYTDYKASQSFTGVSGQ